MALYQLTIAYDGTEFAGFQRQKHARTVQAEIETALRKIGWIQNTIFAAGRTDTGVHAEGQVVTFELEWDHPDEALLRAMNDFLPKDVSVMDAKKAQTGFHPRHDAKVREYRYQIYLSNTRNPCLERFAWRVWPEVDFAKMNMASEVLKGDHDFSWIGVPFGMSDLTTRTIDNAYWRTQAEEDRAYFRISAKSFIYHMVRRLVMITIRIGQGKLLLDELKDCLNHKRELPAGIAPANGLFLEKIIY